MFYQVSDRFEVAQERKAALGRQLSALQDRQSHSERLWGAVSSGIADCQRGSPLSAEDLTTAMATADATRIRDEALFHTAQDLLDAASAEAETCLAKIATIADASEESVRATRAMVERIQHFPLPAQSSHLITQRAKVCAAVFESERFLTLFKSAEEQKVMLDRDMHALRELSAAIAKLAGTALIEPELSLLQSVKDAILLLHWRAEVWFMAQHPIAPTAADTLQKQGEELNGAVQQSPEWAELLAEMEKSGTFVDEADTALAAVNSAKESDIQVSDPAQWYADCAALELRLKGLVERDNALRIKLQSTSQALVESVELLNTVRSAHAKIQEVHRSMNSTGTSTTVDFRDITALTNHLTLAAEKNPSVKLLASLRTEMSQIHSAAAQWNETASNLVPQKAARNKSKYEPVQPTLDVVLAALAEPIARAVVTPTHEKFFRMLQEVDQFRVAFMSFLLPPADSSLVKDSNSNANCNYQSPEFLDKLEKDLDIIKEMKNRAEMIPLDLPEFKVLNWVGALFEWIQSIPYPGDDPKQHAVPMDLAQRKLEESQPIVSTIPANVIETLCRLGVMNFDANAGPVGFHSSIHPNFNLAGDLSDHLEQQIRRTEQLSQRIAKAIDSRRPAVELQKLVDEIGESLVEPAPQVRRALDKALGKSLASKGGVGARSRLEDMSEGESSEYSLEGEEETDNYWTDKMDVSPRPRTGAAGKRARGEDSLLGMSSTSAKRAGVEGKVKLEDKSGRKKGRSAACANPSCPTSSNKLKSSIYCSNHCAMVSAPAMFNALIAYRKLLCIHGCAKRNLVHAEDPTLNLRKVSDADWKAYFLSTLPAKEAVLEIVAGMRSAGFVADSKSTCGRPSDALEAFLQDSDRRMDALNDAGATKQSVESSTVTTSTAQDKKTSYLHNILSALPPAAGPVLLRGDNEGLAAHSAAVKSVGSTPVSTPPAGAAGSNGGSGHVDEDLRLKIRYGLEEMLERTLSRLQVPGAVNHAAIIALDFEDELCLKHATAESKAAKKEKAPLVFDKKEYRKHYLMLVSNLRKPHNDQLVRPRGLL